MWTRSRGSSAADVLRKPRKNETLQEQKAREREFMPKYQRRKAIIHRHDREHQVLEKHAQKYMSSMTKRTDGGGGGGGSDGI